MIEVSIQVKIARQFHLNIETTLEYYYEIIQVVNLGNFLFATLSNLRKFKKSMFVCDSTLWNIATLFISEIRTLPLSRIVLDFRDDSYYGRHSVINMNLSFFFMRRLYKTKFSIVMLSYTKTLIDRKAHRSYDYTVRNMRIKMRVLFWKSSGHYIYQIFKILKKPKVKRTVVRK